MIMKKVKILSQSQSKARRCPTKYKAIDIKLSSGVRSKPKITRFIHKDVVWIRGACMRSSMQINVWSYVPTEGVYMLASLSPKLPTESQLTNGRTNNWIKRRKNQQNHNNSLHHGQNQRKYSFAANKATTKMIIAIVFPCLCFLLLSSLWLSR